MNRYFIFYPFPTRNESVCLLHAEHIKIDKSHQITATNWKSAEAGCSHYSSKNIYLNLIFICEYLIVIQSFYFLQKNLNLIVNVKLDLL